MSDPQFDEITVLDQVEVLPESGVLQVRHEHRVRRDGVVVARDYIRSAYAPGDDLSTADPLVQQLAAIVQTPALVEAHHAAKREDERKREEDRVANEALTAAHLQKTIKALSDAVKAELGDSAPDDVRDAVARAIARTTGQM